MEITKKDVVDRFGEPDFAYASTMYWYKQRVRAIKKKRIGWQMQFIDINTNNDFVVYKPTRLSWVKFTIQKKLKEHWLSFIDKILLGEDSE